MALDLDSVRLFVLAADLGNLTRAAEAAGTVQPIVSQRLKALEARLGRRLLDRSPRFVRPTPDGARFLDKARVLIAAHDEAIAFASEVPVCIAIGISDHALGIGLGPALARVRSVLPAHAVVELKSGLSHEMRLGFEAGLFDAAIVRREGGGADGEMLGADKLGWRARAGFVLPRDGTVPLAILTAPCGVRAVAIRALEERGLAWREAFVAGSCAGLLAGVESGFGIAPMGRLASGDAPDLGPALGLPDLPASEIVLLARSGTPLLATAIRALAASIRASLP